MITLLHVTFALISILFSTYTAIYPTKDKLVISLVLATTTIGSGVMMAVANPAVMLRTCIVGFVYLGFITAITVAGANRLVATNQ